MKRTGVQRPKKKILFVIVVVWIIFSIPSSILIFNKLFLTLQTLKYTPPFEDQAIKYIQTDTDIAEQYQDTGLNLECVKRWIDYYDEFPKFKNSTEFESCVKTMEIYVKVNDKEMCVVVFEKNIQNGKLEITKCFWETNIESDG